MSTSVRVDFDTHQELKQLAAVLHLSIGETLRLAVRSLHQVQLGRELTNELRSEERDWLDAELG